MARLNHNDYPAMNLDELSRPSIIVVDMINGFVSKGALADPEIARAGTPIRSLIERTDSTRQKLLFVTDTHKPGCLEFDSFPEHCLEGSRESQVMDELQEFVTEDNVLRKNSINTFGADGFLDWFSALEKPSDIVITGCCTDLCVLQLALSLQSYINEKNLRGFRIILPVDCVDTYDIPDVHSARQTNRFALDNMKANGIQVVSSIV